MAMMPLMPDLDHSHLDPSWCTSSASSLAAAAAAHQWIHPSLMNYNNDLISNCNENWRGGLLFNQKEIRPVNNPIELANLNPSLNHVMAQDLVFPANSIQDYNDHIHHQEAAAARLQYTLKIKEEMSQDALPRLYEAIREHYQIIDEKLFTRALQNSSHDLLLPFTDLDLMLMNSVSSANRYANVPSGDNGSFNMVLPCVNTLSNNSNSHLAPLPGILDVDLQAFDVLAASRLNTMPFVRDDAAFGPTGALIHQLAQGTCFIQPKVPSLLTGVTAKRGVNNINSSSILENKAPPQSHQDMPRKSRLESRSPSCSSFKVRKEKLGDRIAALQQLVSPFGKTDTASVLMEAIGYINFLHDQVQTLSVPYLSLPKSKKQRTAQGDANEDQREKESSSAAAGGTNKKMDLRSRGLCLVPLSCTSYVTSEITAASHLNTTFSPPNFSFP